MTDQGTRIGPYALEVETGRSGGCSIWHASRADGKARGPTRVAIRVLDDPGDPTAQARLEREYERLRLLDGAGTPRAWALFSGSGALVMELKRGSSLRAMLDAAMAATLDLDEATALEVALGVARVLRHAHQTSGILVHGRLGPQEVLLGRDASVTVLGWGGWSPQPWTLGQAPELRSGSAPGPQTDQYALGALLTAMLEPRTTHEQGLAAARQRLCSRWPASARLLEHLLATEPAARFPDLGPAIHELLSLARHRGGVARVGELAERCADFRRGGASARALLSAISTPGLRIPTPPRPLPPPPAAAPAPVAEPAPVPTPPLAVPRSPEPAGPEPRPVAPEPPPAPASGSPPTPPEPASAAPAPEATPPEAAPPEAAPREAAPREAAPPEAAPPEAPDEPAPVQRTPMELMERVAIAMLGLLALLVLAWIGRRCLGG